MSALPIDTGRAELETESNQIARIAQAIVINDAISYERAAETIRRIADFRKTVDVAFDEHIRNAAATLNSLRQAKASQLFGLDEIERAVRDKMAAHVTETERRKAEEFLKKQAIAVEMEEDFRLRKAVRLENSGDTAAAMKALETPMAVPMVQVAPEEKVKGVSVRKQWKCNRDEFSIVAVAAYVALNPQFASLLTVDWKIADALARAQNKQFNIPGLAAYESTTVAVRGDA